MDNMAKLYLLPMPLGDEWEGTLPPTALELMKSLDYFVAENVKTARRFITKFRDVHPLTFETLNKRTEARELTRWMNVLENGTSIGYMSEAGLPCLADPGKNIVKMAHQKDIPVEVVPGASAIVMALVGSGLNGQKFRFNGYLPPQKGPREKSLKRLARDSKQFKQSEIFMETPYRNEKMIESALKVLPPNMHFTIGANLSQTDAYLKTRLISEWKKADRPNLHKIPAVFCLG
jgi:16S rRNA (cytidine1402-2'-O)-methyltransferase